MEKKIKIGLVCLLLIGIILVSVYPILSQEKVVNFCMSDNVKQCDGMKAKIIGHMSSTKGGYALLSPRFNDTFLVFDKEILEPLRQKNYQEEWVEVEGIIHKFEPCPPYTQCWSGPKLTDIISIRILENPTKITKEQAIEISKIQGFREAERVHINLGSQFGIDKDYVWVMSIGKSLKEGDIYSAIVDIKSWEVLKFRYVMEKGSERENNDSFTYVNDKLKNKLGEEITYTGIARMAKGYYIEHSSKDLDCLFIEDTSLIKTFSGAIGKEITVKGTVERKVTDYGECTPYKQQCGKHLKYCIKVENLSSQEPTKESKKPSPNTLIKVETCVGDCMPPQLPDTGSCCVCIKTPNFEIEILENNISLITDVNGTIKVYLKPGSYTLEYLGCWKRIITKNIVAPGEILIKRDCCTY